MKIAYICAYSEIAFGGDSRVAWELARYMAKSTSNEIWMICPGDKYSIKKDSVESKLSIQTIPATDCLEGISLFSPTLLNVRELYNILDNLNPDIIHSHNVDSTSFVLQGWAMTRKKPFVYTGHLLATKFNDWQDLNLKKALSSIINVSFQLYTKEFYKNCTKIICLNEYAKKDFIEFTKEPSKMQVIPNGHVFRNYNKKVLDIENAVSYNLLFAGYLNERKNQLFLIKMLNYIETDKNVNLYLAGSAMTKEYENILVEEMSKLHSNRKVELLGYVEHEELLKMYDNIHYVVSAALAEVQSLSVIEALGSGTPVIGLENTTTQELIKDEYNGALLKKTISPEKFAEVVSKYLNKSNEAYAKLVSNSNNSVRFLEYSNIAKQYQSFYESLNVSDLQKSKSDEIFKKIGRFFKWEVPQKTFKGRKINYGIALGLISTAVVTGIGVFKAYNKVKGYKKN